MSRNPRVTGDGLIAALERVGFRVLRVKGSHPFLRHEDGRSTVNARTTRRPERTGRNKTNSGVLLCRILLKIRDAESSGTVN